MKRWVEAELQTMPATCYATNRTRLLPPRLMTRGPLPPGHKTGGPPSASTNSWGPYPSLVGYPVSCVGHSMTR